MRERFCGLQKLIHPGTCLNPVEPLRGLDSLLQDTSAAEDKVFAIYTMDDIIKRKNSGQDGSDMLPCESANIILSAPSPMHVRMAREVNESPVSADGGCEGLSESDFPIIPWASAQGKKSVENGGQSTDSPSSAPMFPMNQSSNALTEQLYHWRNGRNSDGAALVSPDETFHRGISDFAARIRAFLEQALEAERDMGVSSNVCTIDCEFAFEYSQRHSFGRV